MQILITIPSAKYGFEYKLLTSLIQNIQQQQFRSVKIKIETKIIDHSQIESHTHHTHAKKNVNPYFSIIVSEHVSSTKCNNHEIYIPIKFEIRSVRFCIEGYFRGFVERMKSMQDITHRTDGVVLQQHKFTPLATIQISNDAEFTEINLPTNEIYTRQDTTYDTSFTTFNTFESFESIESTNDILNEIASGQFPNSLNSYKSGKSLLSVNTESQLTFQPVYILVIVLFVCLFIRIHLLFKR